MENLSFFEGPFDDVGFLLALPGLCSFLDVPSAAAPPQQHRSCLTSAGFPGDLFRLFWKLLTQGVPAVLVLPPNPDSCVSTILSVTRCHDRHALARAVSSIGRGATSLHFCFTSQHNLICTDRAAAVHMTSTPKCECVCVCVGLSAIPKSCVLNPGP